MKKLIFLILVYGLTTLVVHAEGGDYKNIQDIMKSKISGIVFINLKLSIEKVSRHTESEKMGTCSYNGSEFFPDVAVYGEMERVDYDKVLTGDLYNSSGTDKKISLTIDGTKTDVIVFAKAKSELNIKIRSDYKERCNRPINAADACDGFYLVDFQEKCSNSRTGLSSSFEDTTKLEISINVAPL